MATKKTASSTAKRGAAKPARPIRKAATKRIAGAKKTAVSKRAAAAPRAAQQKQQRAAKTTRAALPAKATEAATRKQTVRVTRPVAADAQSLAHALNGLLHTMQTIQHFEESLCSIMHTLRRGRPAGAVLRDLQYTLEQLPAHDYLHEVEALRDATV